MTDDQRKDLFSQGISSVMMEAGWDVSRAVFTNSEETQADAWAQQSTRRADIVRAHWQESGGEAQQRGDSPGLLWGMLGNSPGRGRGVGPSRLVDRDG